MKITPGLLKALGPDTVVVMNPDDYEKFVAKYGNKHKAKFIEPKGKKKK